MADSSRPIVILGAGASGLMAAIAASQVRPRSVLLLEKEARVGRKLLATGNGRCNLLNTQVDKRRFHGSGAYAALGLLDSMPPSFLMDNFAQLGLATREEAGGRVYPFSGQASAVLDVLRLACDRLGVITRTDAPVQTVNPAGEGFRITLVGGEAISAQRVIVAAGGKASPSFGAEGDAYGLLAALGHQITPLYPAIVPLKLPPERIRGLKGVRAQVTLALSVDGKTVQTEWGEGLFTDTGLSGIVAMQLARAVNAAQAKGQRATLSIQLLSEEQARHEAASRATLFAGLPMERFFTGLLHKQLGLCLLREAGIPPTTPISAKTANTLMPLLSGWALPIQGTLPFTNAQMTAGGAAMDGFDPATLSSYLVPGLYACGEALDVDGDCGGYNLMWCWASGIACGQAAARSLEVL